MRLTMRERRALTKGFASRYRRSRKKVKGQLLTEFTEMTGYHRSYAGYLLRHHGKRIRWGHKLVLEGEVKKKKEPRQRARQYDGRVLEALKVIWEMLDFLCGKRLAAILPEIVPILERHRELTVDRATRERLLRISAATIDRLLADERRKYQLKGRSGTKPGTLLKHQIPIKRFAEWQEDRPGFVEVDLVGHDGAWEKGSSFKPLM